jgi:hypothetical protein
MTSRQGWEPMHAFLESFPATPRYHDYRVILEKRQDIDAVVVAAADGAHTGDGGHAARQARLRAGTLRYLT